MSLVDSPFGARSTYKWGQTAEGIDVTFPVAKAVTSKDIKVIITATTIVAGLEGADAAVVQVRALLGQIDAPSCHRQLHYFMEVPFNLFSA